MNQGLSVYSIWESDPRFAYTLVALLVISIIIMSAVSALIIRRRKQKEMLKTQHSLQMMLDLLPVPVRILNVENGKLIYINRAACDMFGINNPETAYGTYCGSYMPETQPDGTDSVEKTYSLNGEKASSAEIVHLRPGGEAFVCLVTACIIDYNGEKSSFAILKDLTAEKEYHRMLKNTAEKEKETHHLKGRFLVDTTHEIRTPTNAIIGLNEIGLRTKKREEEKETLSEFAGLLPKTWPNFNAAIQYADETKRFVHKIKNAADKLSERELYQSAVEFESSMLACNPDAKAYKRLTEASAALKKRISEQ